MIKEFKILTSEETALLLKAPVIVSVQALSAYKVVNKVQKEDAIKLAHIKTFTEHQLLIPYYEEVDKHFKKHFEEYLEQFFPFDTEHCAAIRNEVDKVNAIINKLDGVYAELLRKSLAGFARHIRNAAHNVLQDLIFPVAFSKL